MISGRSHRKKRSRQEACRGIEKEAGKQFDPELAKTFLRIVEDDSRFKTLA
jgi:HD-GYP domain-containing protein (c-di-GMP phosphodiesterase class II)